nr:unnamed protein product [Callosobruchus analis]
MLKDVRKTVKKLKQIFKDQTARISNSTPDNSLILTLTPAKKNIISYKHWDQPSFSKFSPLRGAKDPRTPPPKPKRIFLYNDSTVVAQKTEPKSCNVEQNDREKRYRSRRAVGAVTLSKLSPNHVTYLQLKLMRDAQCVKLRRASEKLIDIRILGAADRSEELEAEKTLLESSFNGFSNVKTANVSDLYKKLIESKITDLKNGKQNPNTPSDDEKKLSSMSISEINFTIKPNSRNGRDPSKEYWMLALTHNTELYMSQPMMPDKNGRLSFKDGLTVFDFEQNLDVQVEVFSIRLDGRQYHNNSITSSKDSFSQLSFHDEFTINGSKIVKSSFQSCGKFTLTAKTGKTSFNLTPPKIRRSLSRSLNVDMMCTV